MSNRPENAKRGVAIACQGGGSHAAFASGVLMELLQSGKFQDEFNLVALTGTSGGAVCASLVRSALHRAKEDQRTRGWPLFVGVGNIAAALAGARAPNANRVRVEDRRRTRRY